MACFNNFDDLHEREIESERFIENKFNASLLTNLNKKDLPLINQCIIEFNQQDNIFTDAAYDIYCNRLHGYIGVYIYERFGNDLSEFWDRFDQLKRR